MIAENFNRIICPRCKCVNGHDPSCPIVVLYGHTVTTSGEADLYVVMSCGHQRRYWFGEDELGYCTLCEIARLMNPPLIILSGSTGNKEFKP